MLGKAFLFLVGILFLVACSPATPAIISPTPEPEPLIFSTATLQPTQTPWITSTPRPTYTPNATKTKLAEATPTLDLMSLTEPWKTYTDRELGISFDYPAMFDDMDGCEILSYQADGLREGPDEFDFMGFDEWNEIRIGSGRFIINIVETNDVTLSDAVDLMIENAPYGFNVLSRSDVIVGDHNTIQLEAFFSGYPDYYRFTFFHNQNTVFVIIKNADWACDVDEDKTINRKSHLREYFRLVESIRFLN